MRHGGKTCWFSFGFLGFLGLLGLPYKARKAFVPSILATFQFSLMSSRLLAPPVGSSPSKPAALPVKRGASSQHAAAGAASKPVNRSALKRVVTDVFDAEEAQRVSKARVSGASAGTRAAQANAMTRVRKFSLSSSDSDIVFDSESGSSSSEV